MKLLKYILVLVVIGVVIFFVMRNKTAENVITEVPQPTPYTVDPLNMSYNISGEVFTLKNGIAEKDTAIDTDTKNSLVVFGSPVYGDLDGDKDQDAAVWLVNDPGGTGKFFYGALVINNGTSAKATEVMFLGDRIAPQTLEIHDGRAVYNFAERKASDPMTAEPSVGRSIWVNYDAKTGQIGEWVKDFEGEADPSKMTLGMKTWEWVSTTYNDGKKIVPKDPERFQLTFKSDGTFSASTDCNGVGGKYVVKGKSITFSEMMSTLMFCEGSQENDFRKGFEQAGSYFFTSKGELVFNLKFDSGSVIFR